MDTYLRNTIILSIANALLVAVGVMVLPSLTLAVLWAVGALVIHFVALVWVAVAELNAEFGYRDNHPTRAGLGRYR
jgi:hypothetical protein